MYETNGTTEADYTPDPHLREAIIKGLERAFREQGRRTNGHYEAAMAALTSGSLHAARSIWVGSTGEWAAQAGTDAHTHLRDLPFETRRRLYTIVDDLATEAMANVQAEAERGRTET